MESWIIRVALTCQSGGFLGSSLQASQAVYTPLWITVKVPLERSARAAAMRVLSGVSRRSESTKPSRKSSLRSNESE